jgi:hypothetical protein
VRRAAQRAGLLAAGALLGACGNRPATPPNVSIPQPPAGFGSASYPRAGLGLRVPSNWAASQGQGDLVVSVTSGAAIVNVWRYRRSEPLPATTAAFQNAKAALLVAARSRDPTLRIQSARVIRFHNRPALELLGAETVGGARRTVRSTHIFRLGSEIVVDALAPRATFAHVDRSVFTPLLRSLKVGPLPRPS